jgi:FKBP-type peptidyl-prolyl cis-trans isomerase
MTVRILVAAATALALSACATQPADSTASASTGSASTASAQTTATASATPAPAMNGADTFVMPTNLQRTPSGLQYVIDRPGNGEGATRGQTARVHYTGWLTNGTKFDSSRDRGAPYEFTIGGGRVIKGWDEGVVGMKVGERRTLVVPASLAYGPGGMSGVIPPNATLVFTLELLGTR